MSDVPTSNLVSRLRAAPPFDPANRQPGDSIYQMCAAAADEIERLLNLLAQYIKANAELAMQLPDPETPPPSNLVTDAMERLRAHADSIGLDGELSADVNILRDEIDLLTLERDAARREIARACQETRVVIARETAQMRKDAADIERLRSILDEAGIDLEQTLHGATWKRRAPETTGEHPCAHHGCTGIIGRDAVYCSDHETFGDPLREVRKSHNLIAPGVWVPKETTSQYKGADAGTSEGAGVSATAHHQKAVANECSCGAGLDDGAHQIWCSVKTETPHPDDETPCTIRDDGMHCECWYGGNTCCGCGDGDRKLSGGAYPTCAEIRAEKTFSPPGINDDDMAAERAIYLAGLQEKTGDAPWTAGASSTGSTTEIGGPSLKASGDLPPAFQSLLDLQPNWDSYGAKRINLACIQKAHEIWKQLAGTWLPVPHSDGTVGLEQHSGGFDIEIDIDLPLERER